MLNPTPFFAADFFGTKDVTLSRLQKFSLNAVQRLGLDNPGGVFTALGTELTGMYTALFGAMQDTDAGTAGRRGHAQLMWAAIGRLQDQLEADEPLINFKSQKNPLIRAAFFPNNREEYSRATLLTADLLFARAQAAATTHAAALGPEFDPALYAQAHVDFEAARTGTGAGDELAAKARAQASTQRDDLTARLTDAVKLVAAQFPRDEARCNSYFRFELLSAGTPAPPPDAPAA